MAANKLDNLSECEQIILNITFYFYSLPDVLKSSLTSHIAVFQQRSMFCCEKKTVSEGTIIKVYFLFIVL